MSPREKGAGRQTDHRAGAQWSYLQPRARLTSTRLHLFKGGPPEGVTGGTTWDLTPRTGQG